MKFFRFQLRFIAPITIILIVAAILAFPAMDILAQRWFLKDINLRSDLVASAFSESVSKAIFAQHPERLLPLFERAVKDERLTAIGLCGPDGTLILATSEFPDSLNCAQAKALMSQSSPRLVTESGAFHVSTHSTLVEGNRNAEIILLHDLSYIERRTILARQYLVIFIISLGLLIALTTIIAAQLSWNAWIKGLRGLLRGEDVIRAPLSPPPPELPKAIVDDIHLRLREMRDAYQLANRHENNWNADRLKSLLRTQLRGDQLIVVSNREPYIHERIEGKLITQQPASGLVTAIEPVMRACAGIWIAHGSGNADRETADKDGYIALPPEAPEYTLRRLWLSREEEEGYYYGLANSGLWPLCHHAHIQPKFNAHDWEIYKNVNQRFADAVVRESRTEDPVVLVQDYHLALVPAMVRSQLPQATILSFWHIPWPSADAFKIFPWKNEILHGMLGSTILGFQTRQHCQSFMETVDRSLEARLDHERFTIMHQGEETLIENYPISIDWPTEAEQNTWESTEQLHAEFCCSHNFPQDTKIILGVDRCDYIKGIPERLAAFEMLLEKNPDRIGKIAFIQIAAPSREHLDEYRSFQNMIEQCQARINRRFGHPGYQPVHVFARHHTHAEIRLLYRVASICIVSSLHDGMNLVCKEFISSRNDERGVLLLSQFAGATFELPEALSINPYHIEGMSAAILQALTMPETEQRERMASMRMTVRDANVFRWAGRMLSDASRQRLRNRVESRVKNHSCAETQSS